MQVKWPKKSCLYDLTATEGEWGHLNVAGEAEVVIPPLTAPEKGAEAAVVRQLIDANPGVPDEAIAAAYAYSPLAKALTAKRYTETDERYRRALQFVIPQVRREMTS